jgi:hypothetical protein
VSLKETNCPIESRRTSKRACGQGIRSANESVGFVGLDHGSFVQLWFHFACGNCRPQQSRTACRCPASAPGSDFSAERAIEHLKVIAHEPHPTGSIANALVRDNLISGMRCQHDRHVPLSI